MLVLDIKHNRLIREDELTQNEVDVLKALSNYRFLTSGEKFLKDKKISKKALTNIIHRLRDEEHVDIETRIRTGYILKEVMFIDY